MKVLIGVDCPGHHGQIKNLLERLQFPKLEIVLVHAVQSVLPDASFPGTSPGMEITAVFNELQAAGEAALAHAKDLYANLGPVSTKLVFGDPARELIEASEAEGCDLIAVASTSKSYYGSLFFGSVAKGLIIGAKRDLLIVKHEHPASGPVNALVATDHSPYMQRCFGELRKLGPAGLGQVTLLSVYDRDTRLTFGHKSGDEEAGLSQLQAKTDEAAGSLSTDAITFTPQVAAGELDEVLQSVVESTKAELVVMGAQGQGFFERIAVGSSSLHQAITGSQSLLLLRPAEGVGQTG